MGVSVSVNLGRYLDSKIVDNVLDTVPCIRENNMTGPISEDLQDFIGEYEAFLATRGEVKLSIEHCRGSECVCKQEYTNKITDQGKDGNLQ